MPRNPKHQPSTGKIDPEKDLRSDFTDEIEMVEPLPKSSSTYNDEVSLHEEKFPASSFSHGEIFPEDSFCCISSASKLRCKIHDEEDFRFGDPITREDFIQEEFGFLAKEHLFANRKMDH